MQKTLKNDQKTLKYVTNQTIAKQYTSESKYQW